MKNTPDVVTCLLSLVRATVSVTDDQARQIEEKIRHEWGGEQVTIQKRAPLNEAKKRRVVAEVGTKPLEQIRDENGISRATLYRWIGASKAK